MAQRKEKQQAVTDTYQGIAADIDTHLKALAGRLAAHRKRHEAEPRNWGYVGDLTHARELLAQINEFFGAPEAGR